MADEADVRRAINGDKNLEGADLSAADLSGKNLSGANLKRANLAHADLRGTDLSSSTLVEARLDGALLSRGFAGILSLETKTNLSTGIGVLGTGTQ